MYAACPLLAQVVRVMWSAALLRVSDSIRPSNSATRSRLAATWRSSSTSLPVTSSLASVSTSRRTAPNWGVDVRRIPAMPVCPGGRLLIHAGKVAFHLGKPGWGRLEQRRLRRRGGQALELAVRWPSSSPLLTAERERLDAELAGIPAAQGKAQALSDEVALWKLLAKALGNDGAIALSIDDADPALTGIVNDLLLA